MFRVMKHWFKFSLFFIFMVLQWQNDNRQEVLYFLQSTKAWQTQMLLGPLNPWIKLTSFSGFVSSLKPCPLFDTLSYLEICDITNNSVGYQNSFRVEFNPRVNNMLFSNSSLHIPVPICMGHCKWTWWILASAGNILQRPWPHHLPAGVKFKMFSLPCKVS